MLRKLAALLILSCAGLGVSCPKDSSAPKQAAAAGKLSHPEYCNINVEQLLLDLAGPSASACGRVHALRMGPSVQGALDAFLQENATVLSCVRDATLSGHSWTYYEDSSGDESMRRGAGFAFSDKPEFLRVTFGKIFRTSAVSSDPVHGVYVQRCGEPEKVAEGNRATYTCSRWEKPMWRCLDGKRFEPPVSDVGINPLEMPPL